MRSERLPLAKCTNLKIIFQVKSDDFLTYALFSVPVTKCLKFVCIGYAWVIALTQYIQ